MDWTGSVGCQNCIALNKKLELFDLLKQRCCKTDDITKNFLVLKTSYEKSAKVLENKSKKLSEARNKLKDAEKAEETIKRKAAEFQLRLVASDNKCQDLLKNLDVEKEKNVILLQEKVHLETLVETKENEITSLNIVSKQCEERFANELSSLNSKLEKKMEKKIDGFKLEIQKLQDLNTKLKSLSNYKKRYEKLREDIVDIFKDGVVLTGEPLKRFKRLLNRLQENETAAKLEAILDTPSMTPDGTTSSDTGVFSGDEDFGCPSLGNDLEMSSDSDEDLESVQPQSNMTWSVASASNPAHYKMSKATSSPLEERFPATELINGTCGSNVSNASENDGDNTLCPIASDSATDGFDMDLNLTDNNKNLEVQTSASLSENSSLSTKAEGLLDIFSCNSSVNNPTGLTSSLSSPSRTLGLKSTLENSPLRTDTLDANASNAGITDSLFAPPGGDVSPSLMSHRRDDNYDISFDTASTVPNEKCTNSCEMSSKKSDIELPDLSVASKILTSQLDSELANPSIPKLAEKSITIITSPAISLECNANLKKSPNPLSKEKGDYPYLSENLSRESTVPSNNPISAAIEREICNNSIDSNKKHCNALHDGNSQLNEDLCSSSHKVPKSSSENIQDCEDDSMTESKPQEDEMDLDLMLHEWNPPTPILPFSDDSCGFDGSSLPSSTNLIDDLPTKIVSTVSVGTNTDLKHVKSTASSPISHLFMKNSSTSTDGGFKQEKIYQDAFSSPPRISSCNKASSPMKIRCKNIGVMPIAELTRDVAVSPVKVMKKSLATSPLRSLFKDVSVSPLKLEKWNRATNTSNFEITVPCDNKEESWSHEAKLLQQTLEVLGISTGDLSNVVLDQSLVDELRKAMEMALRKTSKPNDISSRKPLPSKQFDTSYCSFNPCEFAEICNQQHYNLHLLAKAKRVERTICLREKRPKHKLKRLKSSSRRQRSLSSLSFKEEVLEEDYSSVKKTKPNNIFEDHCTVEKVTMCNNSHFETTASDESHNIKTSIAPETGIIKSLSPSENGNEDKIGKPVQWKTNAKSQISVMKARIGKPDKPGASHQNNLSGMCLNSTENRSASLSCDLLSTTNNAADVGCVLIDRTPSGIERNSLDSAVSQVQTVTVTQFENTVNEESHNISSAISPKSQVTNSLIYSKSGHGSKPDKLVELMSDTQSPVSVTIQNVSKSFEHRAIYPSKSNINLNLCKSTNGKNASTSCESLDTMRNAMSNAPDNPNGEASKKRNSHDLATPNSKNVQSQHEHIVSDSDSSEDNLIIDERGNTSPILPEVLSSNISSEKVCKLPVHGRESIVPDAGSFVLPKPVGMSLRKRQKSSSSESSNAENSPGVNDNLTCIRRSPRTKKTRTAHGENSELLQSYKKGYSNFVKCETSGPCEAKMSTEKQTKQSNNNLPSSKLCDATMKKLSSFKFEPPSVTNKEEYSKGDDIPSVPETASGENGGCISNSQSGNRPLKRSAENKPMDDEFGKRTKRSSMRRSSVHSDSPVLPKVSSSGGESDNGLEDSDIDMEFNAKQTVETEISKAPTIRTSSIARKPSKLQKLRTSVSKVHPMVQGTKIGRSPGVSKEQFSFPNSVDQCVPSTLVAKPSSPVRPNLTEDSKDESSIIERLRGRVGARLAAAASGRTAQLIQVKPGTNRPQRPAALISAGLAPTKPVTRVARTQPLVRPADRITALGGNTPSKPTEKSSDCLLSVSSTAESPSLHNGGCQNSTAVKSQKQACEGSPRETEVSVPQRRETYVSSLISDVDLRISTLSPLVYALAEQQNFQPPACNKKELRPTQVLVATTLKEFTAAPSFTPEVLQKAVNALSAPNLYNILPVLVQNIVKMMDDDYDTTPLCLRSQQSYAPPLTPVQQQLVTLIIQLSSQHQHLEQLPHQLLRLLEYRVFRLGLTPEGDRLVWCSKLHAAICRLHGLRTQALIFCWDSLYALKGRSYHVVKAVVEVWPFLFPFNPTFENACPNAQVLLHFLLSHGEDKGGKQKFDNSCLRRLLRSRGLQSLTTNSSILASSIFSNIISGATDTNLAALVLLAKREEENWTMRDVVSQKLLPAFDSWRNGSLSDVAGERVIWILCSILRAIPPERNGNSSNTLMKLLMSELLKPESTLPPQMQEVIALGLAMLSRHDLENVAAALASWNPNYGPSRGFSSRLLQYLTAVINNGVRPVCWWQSLIAVSKAGQKDKIP